MSDLSSQLLHQKADHTKPCLTAHFELVTSAGHSMCSIISLQTADDHQNHLRPQKIPASFQPLKSGSNDMKQSRHFRERVPRLSLVMWFLKKTIQVLGWALFGHAPCP